jgi:ATP-binding cassette subfamily C protein
LRGVSFTVAPGEAVAIAGASAAGKSTLARLMLGVLKPTGGAVRLGGHDVYSWDRNSFGRYVGYMPQGVELFDATVAENIARLQDAPTDHVVAAAKAAGAHAMIGRLPYGYDTPVGNSGFMLTGGQRQRLALARALFGEPQLLVLDEPDAHLDEAAQGDLHRAVAAAKARGAAVVVVSHRETVLAAMDRVILLQDGQVARTGYRNDVPSPEHAQRGPRPVASGAAE